MKKKSKIIIAVIVGFAIAMVLMSIAIYFGYTKAYDTNVGEYNVKLIGISIYKLTLSGKKYTGTYIGTNMGIICGVFVLVSVLVEKIIGKICKKQQ